MMIIVIVVSDVTDGGSHTSRTQITLNFRSQIHTFRRQVS